MVILIAIIKKLINYGTYIKLLKTKELEKNN